MLGRCLITTSSAWIASKGICRVRPSSASSSAYSDTCAFHLMLTRNTRSLPSPGSVTSSSIGSLPMGSGSLVYMLLRPSNTGLRLLKILPYACTIVSMMSLLTFLGHLSGWMLIR